MSARGAIKLHPIDTSAEQSEACESAEGMQFYCHSSTYPAIVLLPSTLFCCLTIEQFLIQVPSEVRHSC